jgi:hypothetical protein
MGMYNRSENSCSAWDVFCAHPNHTDTDADSSLFETTEPLMLSPLLCLQTAFALGDKF